MLQKYPRTLLKISQRAIKKIFHKNSFGIVLNILKKVQKIAPGEAKYYIFERMFEKKFSITKMLKRLIKNDFGDVTSR